MSLLVSRVGQSEPLFLSADHPETFDAHRKLVDISNMFFPND
jgi:hypothetical protein